jgi:hypothetical protein
MSKFDVPRPYNFWRWRTARPFWHFLGYFTLTLVVLQVLFSSSAGYVSLQGAVALAIEAVLPLPQIVANHQRRCCKGFRVSVLANWLAGDSMKMIFFFAKNSDDVPWAFKVCGIFQAACDVFLGVQYFMFGDGEPMPAKPWNPAISQQQGAWAAAGTPVSETREMQWMGDSKKGGDWNGSTTS